MTIYIYKFLKDTNISFDYNIILYYSKKKKN